jgi:hypothetical protein
LSDGEGVLEAGDRLLIGTALHRLRASKLQIVHRTRSVSPLDKMAGQFCRPFPCARGIACFEA